MINNRASSKQSGVLGTSWRHKLKTDQFFRTEFMVIGILFLLCFANVAIMAIALEELQIDIASSVVKNLGTAITDALTSGQSGTATTELVLTEVGTLSDTGIFTVLILSLLVTVLLGYVTTRIALAPTRNALASQKQFIGNVAHELRTPLSIIRANSEIILLQKKVNAESLSLLMSNIEELDRISGIINNLLTLNSFRNSGAMTFEEILIGTVVRDVISQFEKYAREKGVELDAETDDDEYVWGNKSGLVQIIMNVVRNALVYTPKGGSVFVSVKRTSPAFVALEVRDTGIGIESEKIKKIFEPFYQVSPSRSENRGSSGLGLAIVNELVKLHHGKISIQSEPGEGTIVTIELPAIDRSKSREKKGSDTSLPSSSPHHGMHIDYTVTRD